MSAEEIMTFLDSHPGEVFSPKQILEGLGNKVNLNSLYSSLKSIVKRREYFCEVQYNPGTQLKCDEIVNKKKYYLRYQSYPVIVYGVVTKNVRRKKG